MRWLSRQGARTAGLHLVVPLEQRLDLGASDAVQGELFVDEGARRPTRGYPWYGASKVAGITYRQLDYWARKQIVEPSITPSHGSGSRRLYSFKDVVILAVSKKLLDAGVNLQNVTTAIGFLMQRDVDQLEHVTIMCDGEEVHECTTSDQMIALLQSGKAVFGVSVGSLWHQIHDALETETTSICSRPRRTSAPQGRDVSPVANRRAYRHAHAQEDCRPACRTRGGITGGWRMDDLVPLLLWVFAVVWMLSVCGICIVRSRFGTGESTPR